MIKIDYWWLWYIIFFSYIIIPRKKLYLEILNKKRIVEIEENWIKVEEKKKVRIINGDMIQDISILSEEYEK